MTQIRDYLIIGSGPGALQLGYFLQRNGRDYSILERGDAAGTFFERYPRHRQLLSINKVHTGYREACRRLRYDWNSLLSDDPELRFPRYSRRYFPAADDLVRYLRDFAERFELDIRYGAEVTRVTREAGLFRVHEASGLTRSCRQLVLATGLSVPVTPSIPGVEHAEHYADYSVDPTDFEDQRVLILGKGNSAFETANALNESARSLHLCSPEPVRLAWETHYVGHLRAVNNDFIDTYQLKSQNAILDAEVERIERQAGEICVTIRFTHAAGQRIRMAYDRVLLATGFRFDNDIFDDSCRPELTLRGKYPKMSSTWESTNVKGLHFTGGLMHSRDFHKTMSSFVHGFRHNIDAQARLWEHVRHGHPLHDRVLPLDGRVLAAHAAERTSMSAELFLQPGFLCDAYLLDPGSGRVLFYRGLPADYVRESILVPGTRGFTVSLEYGAFGMAPLAVVRDPRPGSREAYLHPVIRRIHDGRVIDERNLPDNLENDWGSIDRFQIQRTLGLGGDEESHEAPYASLFEDCFSLETEHVGAPALR